MSLNKTIVITTLCAGALLAAHRAGAQNEGSAVISLLPVASVSASVSRAGATASGSAAIPVALLASGAAFTVRAIEVSARGTLVVLESASEGVAVGIELSGLAAAPSALTVGASVTSTLIAAGVVLSAADQALCLIPNAIGRALLHNEKIG